MVAFDPKISGQGGTYERCLIISFSGRGIMRWWGHSSPTLCKRICLNVLHSQAVGAQKNVGHVHIYAWVPLPTPEPSSKTFINYFIKRLWQNKLINTSMILHFTNKQLFPLSVPLIQR